MKKTKINSSISNYSNLWLGIISIFGISYSAIKFEEGLGIYILFVASIALFVAFIRNAYLLYDIYLIDNDSILINRPFSKKEILIPMKNIEKLDLAFNTILLKIFIPSKAAYIIRVNSNGIRIKIKFIFKHPFDENAILGRMKNK